MRFAQASESEFDAGPKSAGAGAERLCVSTRMVKPVAEMIRFVVGPDGEVLPDLKRKLPGRGIWVTAGRAAMSDAIRGGAFKRGFGREVKVSPELIGATEQLLRRSALDALAIAGKAGQVITGFSKVEAALARIPVMAVLNASDAAADGVRKIAGALRQRRDAEGREISVIDSFTSAELDLALSRSNVVHAALLAGPSSQTFVARCALLNRFQAVGPGQRTDRNTRKQTPKD